MKFYLTNNLWLQNSNICTLQNIVQMRKYDVLNQILQKPIKLIFFCSYKRDPTLQIIPQINLQPHK